MIRRFRQHEARQVVDLEGIWDFRFLGDVDPDEADPIFITCNDTVAVPGCFDASPRYAGRRGLALYRRHIHLAYTTRHRVTFNGVHHWCRVHLIQNGECTSIVPCRR